MEDGFLNNKDLRDTNEIRPEIIQISLLYSIVVALFTFLGPRLSSLNLGFYINGIMGEVLLVLIPPLIFLIYFRYDVIKVLRLRKISLLNLFIVFWLVVFSIPLAGVVNILNMLLVKLIFGRLTSVDIPVATNWMALLLGILVIGGSAGLCEEFLFRGVIQRGFERFGITKAIIITSILFGLLHRDMQRLFGTAILGALIGFIVYRTNSIYGGMFAHFTNNSIAVVFGFIFTKLPKVKGLGGSGIQKGDSLDQLYRTYSTMPKQQLEATIIVWSFILIICIATFATLMYAFLVSTSDKVERVQKERVASKKKALLWLIPGVLLVGFIYFIQGTKMAGIKIDILDRIIQLLGMR